MRSAPRVDVRARAAFTWSSCREGCRRIGVGMEEGGDHHRPPGLGGELLEIGDRGLAALGQHVDAACRSRPSRAPGCAARGRRPGATASASRPRRCGRLGRGRGGADRAGLHGAAHQIGHLRRPPSSVAVRSVASSPITKVRMAEWPAKQATLGPTPWFSSMSRYWGKLSNSQLMPARRASSDMPSTWVR